MQSIAVFNLFVRLNTILAIICFSISFWRFHRILILQTQYRNLLHVEVARSRATSEKQTYVIKYDGLKQ